LKDPPKKFKKLGKDLSKAFTHIDVGIGTVLKR
jgi:hypothetical protein